MLVTYKNGDTIYFKFNSVPGCIPENGGDTNERDLSRLLVRAAWWGVVGIRYEGDEHEERGGRSGDEPAKDEDEG